MNRAMHRVVLTTFSLYLCGCSSPPVSPLNPCIVTAPQSAITQIEVVKTAEVELTAFGSDILRGGIQSSSKTRLETIFKQVPDSQVACQMLLQLGACMVAQKQEIGKEFIELVENKSICVAPALSIASTPGTQVYIQIGNASQSPLGKSIQLALSDKGFLAPGVQNMKGIGMPTLNEVRYYYPSQFNDAKLVKSTLAEKGISEVMLKPLYALPNKPPLEKAFLEVWLP